MNVFIKSIFASFRKTLKNQNEMNKFNSAYQDVWCCVAAVINTREPHSTT